jgi:flavin prenyltransferase
MAVYTLGVTGASGIVLAKKALRSMVQLGHEVHVVFSRAALQTASLELDDSYGSARRFLDDLPEPHHEQVHIHRNSDIAAPIASGSFKTDGMLLVPCSMATLAAIAMGLGDNLIRRAADVCLKERRRLVIAPRETPLHEAHLENMTRLSRMGAIIAPPIPGWYTNPQSLSDVENGMVGRLLDQLGLDVHYKRWKSEGLGAPRSGDLAGRM